MTIEQKQCILKFFGCYDGAVDGSWGPLSKQGTEKLQRLLGIPDDGLWGPQTDAAARQAIGEGLDLLPPEEEKPNVPNQDAASEEPSKTGTFWDEIEFFDREEFRCQCNGQFCDGFHVEPEETMVRLCDEIRRRAGVRILIRDAGGSGLRCPQWNASIPGAAANSYHVKGMAADLHPRGKTPEQLYAIAEAVMAEMIPGRGGLGIYNWGIHVDDGKYSRWDSRG